MNTLSSWFALHGDDVGMTSCVNHFLSYFYSSFSFFFKFSGCNFKFSFSFSWVAPLGIRVILPLVINNFNIIGYTVGWSQCLESISLKLYAD